MKYGNKESEKELIIAQNYSGLFVKKMPTVRKRMLATTNDVQQIEQLMLLKLRLLKLPTHNAAAKDAKMMRPGLQNRLSTPSSTAKNARMRSSVLQSGLLTPNGAL